MRRDGRGAALGPPPPSLSDPEPGQLWARSHVSRRYPSEKLRRCRDTSALFCSSFQRCAHKLHQHLPALCPHRRLLLLLLLQACSSYRHRILVLPLCIAMCCSQCRGPPTSPGRCTQNLTGQSMQPLPVPKKRKRET